MVDLLGFIKNLLLGPVDNRKRKASTELYCSPTSPKHRKLQTSQMQGDDWMAPYVIRRRGSLHTSLNRNKPSSSKENVTLTIDDDEDDIHEISTSKFNKVSSTPNFISLPTENGDDDVTFIKSSKSLAERKLKAKKLGFEYMSQFNHLSDNQNKRRNLSKGVKYEPTSPILSSIKEIKAKLNMSRPAVRSTALDETFRLEEKKKYQELLAKAAPTYSSLTNSFSKYSTPVGKIFVDNSKRSKQIMDMALNKTHKSIGFVDLTNGSNDAPKKQMSTKDTIKKVLSEYSTEPITIKDSESDGEIFPRPPSPKPDIKVERVNSLKTIVDISKETSRAWLNKLVEKHRKNVAKMEIDIRNQTAQRNKLGEVTSEIQAQRLEDQMVKCLKIKDVVLPVEYDLPFPDLTADEEYAINRALKGKNTSEVLVSKFSLNITRADIQTLAGLNWLNDEVINFYMNLLIERGKNPKWPTVYAMNTFFYPKLMKDGHSSLRRWTRKVDIFSYDMMVVPIHLGVHWCLSIIDFRKKSIKYYDSMDRSNQLCIQGLFNYLKAEHLDKKQKEFDGSDWFLGNADNVPQQMNGSDCGVFSCTFAEFVTRNAKLTFSQEDMPYLRRKIVLEILNGELITQ